MRIYVGIAPFDDPEDGEFFLVGMGWKRKSP
jgi:hypothetical protein